MVKFIAGKSNWGLIGCFMSAISVSGHFRFIVCFIFGIFTSTYKTVQKQPKMAKNGHVSGQALSSFFSLDLGAK